MKRKFNKQEVIEIGKKLAKANFVTTYKPRSHSHNIGSLFPQTEAQYEWLKRECGITTNVLIFHTEEEVLKVAPELIGCIRKSGNGQSCRIEIILY